MTELFGWLFFGLVVSLVWWSDRRSAEKWERLELERARSKHMLPCPYKRP